MADDAPTVLLRSEDSDGQLAVVDLGGGGRPPLHRHDVDETFYVLEGELTFRHRDDLVVRGAGELAFAPRGEELRGYTRASRRRHGDHTPNHT